MDQVIPPIMCAFVSRKQCYIFSPNHYSKDQSIFTFIEANLFAGITQQHLSSKLNCSLFTPVPPSGSRGELHSTGDSLWNRVYLSEQFKELFQGNLWTSV